MGDTNFGSQYRSVSDLSLLCGRPEDEIRAEADRLGIRLGEDLLPAEAARRLLASLECDDLSSAQPGFSTKRVLHLIERSIASTRLDLSGLTVLTEAATGVYAVTPVIAALAGAKQVHAVTKASRYGSVEEVVRSTRRLAEAAGVSERLSITERIPFDCLGSVDLVTNSGHLRPITRNVIAHLRRSAVVALMYEAWEFRESDVDVDACVEAGIAVVGVNERNPSLDIFSYLGELCARQMQSAGVSVCNSKIALLCDNDFGEPIKGKLEGLGGVVSLVPSVDLLPASEWDAIIVALQPAGPPRLGPAEVLHLKNVIPQSAAIIQFWGDVDRSAAASSGLQIWPPEPPPWGHMAALLSELGPEPIVRLQTGALRAAECIIRKDMASAITFAQVVDPKSISRM